MVSKNYDITQSRKNREEYIKSKFPDNVEYLASEILYELENFEINKRNLARIESDLSLMKSLLLEFEIIERELETRTEGLSFVFNEDDFHDVREIPDDLLKEAMKDLEDVNLENEDLEREADGFIAKLDQLLGKFKVIIPYKTKKKIFIVLLLFVLGGVLVRTPNCSLNIFSLIDKYESLLVLRKKFLELGYSKIEEWGNAYIESGDLFISVLLKPLLKYDLFRTQVNLNVLFQMAKSNIEYIIRIVALCDTTNLSWESLNL